MNNNMLIVFLTLTLVSMLLGFSNRLPEPFAGIVQLLFIVFLVLSVASWLFGNTRRDDGC